MALMTTLLSADDYFRTGDERPRPTELINGEVVVNSPNLLHQRIVARIHNRLFNWTEEADGRGESPAQIDIRLDTGNVFAPDVVWISEKRRPRADAAFLDGPPDLAVEVRSASTWRYDVGTKKDTYERAGLPELWLVDTASSSVLVYRRSSPEAGFDVELELSGDDLLTSPQLDGFSVRVAELFPT